MSLLTLILTLTGFLTLTSIHKQEKTLKGKEATATYFCKMLFTKVSSFWSLEQVAIKASFALDQSLLKWLALSHTMRYYRFSSS